MDFLEPLLIWLVSCFPFFIPLIVPVGSYGFYKHAARHTDGTDDIQDATSAQKGLMTAAQATELEESSEISTAQWGYLAAMNQGVAITDKPTFQGIDIGAYCVKGQKISISDDNVWVHPSEFGYGSIFISEIFCNAARWGQVEYETKNNSRTHIFLGGADFEVTLGVLGGTTGNDGKLTFSVDAASDNIYIENRLGATVYLKILLFGWN